MPTFTGRRHIFYTNPTIVNICAFEDQIFWSRIESPEWYGDECVFPATVHKHPTAT